MIISKELLCDNASKLGIELDETAVESLNKYAELLIETNKQFNLTAIIEPDDIVIKHFVDSLSILKYVDIPMNSKIIDVGTGAGFPGLVLLIARPDLKVTFLDGTKKKLGFIETVMNEIGLSAEILHARAEEAGRNPKYREKFDFATARALSELCNLVEYCSPFVKVGGSFISMKGKDTDEEISSAKFALKTLSCEITLNKNFTINGEIERKLVVIKKISQTSPKYPRPSAQIAKKPLK